MIVICSIAAYKFIDNSFDIAIHKKMKQENERNKIIKQYGNNKKY